MKAAYANQITKSVEVIRVVSNELWMLLACVNGPQSKSRAHKVGVRLNFNQVDSGENCIKLIKHSIWRRHSVVEEENHENLDKAINGGLSCNLAPHMSVSV